MSLDFSSVYRLNYQKGKYKEEALSLGVFLRLEFITKNSLTRISEDEFIFPSSQVGTVSPRDEDAERNVEIVDLAHGGTGLAGELRTFTLLWTTL